MMGGCIRSLKFSGFALLAALPMSGCGKPTTALGHGASTEPTVTVLLAEGSDAQAAAGPAETTAVAATIRRARIDDFRSMPPPRSVGELPALREARLVPWANRINDTFAQLNGH